MKIKIARWRNFNTFASSHSISFAKNKVSCVAISASKVKSYSNFEMPILKCYSPFRYFSVLFKCRYGRKMRKCEGVTKYKCLECFTFVCNVCSKFREDHDIYHKEEKLIGRCENCDGNQVAVKQKSANKQ